VRFLAYFFLVFVTLSIFRQMPVLGGIFRVPLLGFFLAAIVVSTVFARVGEYLTKRARLQKDIRELGQVDTPRRRGKLGRLLLNNGQAAKAIEPLREALAADPENVDWHYRLGSALLKTGEPLDALHSLERALELNEGFAYGGVLLELSNAALAVGDGERALQCLERHTELQGDTPEGAYRTGLALKALGRKEEANAAFRATTSLIKETPKYQKADAYSWALRAFWARIF
jgi:tetratricopeptide (TPR) repeat protein